MHLNNMKLDLMYMWPSNRADIRWKIAREGAPIFLIVVLNFLYGAINIFVPSCKLPAPATDLEYKYWLISKMKAKVASF